MNTRQILDLGRRSSIYAEQWAGFEWLVHLYAHLTSPPETPQENAPRYPAWLKLVEYMEQSIQSYVPATPIAFDRSAKR